ncbi:TerC family protein [Effusibacillus dendaii]|uniref:Membrane protein n=1 Tax=Effusibacillus dendaii TaxID=2743772 RepID=A0A7I8DDL0_9BACL|nr:TerC family protein [Effusibacillus dendaii]BCJ87049.1 membrane protein [Effusibacillus dendaii]
MEFFSVEFWVALMSIVLIDLVLAGDNAILIGLSARNLAKEQQKKAILWGTVGAVVIRAVSTLAVVWLLKIPGLLLIGGIALLLIAYKLLVEKKRHDQQAASQNLWSAIRTIIIADALMGLDNVLAVAGAAHGSFLLILIGLLISIPIMVWGSTLIVKWVERYRAIVYIGSGTIAWTAAKMMMEESFVKPYFANPFLHWGGAVAVACGVLLAGVLKNQKHQKQPTAGNTHSANTL